MKRLKRLFELRWKIGLFRRIAPAIARWTPSCAQMTRRSSMALEIKPGWREKFWRLAHYLICDWCRRYTAQIRFLRSAAPRSLDHLPAVRGPSLPAEARQRIKERLRKSLEQ